MNEKINLYYLFLIILILNISLILFANYLKLDFGESGLENKSRLNIFFLVVIFAPIFETLLFNVAPVKLLQLLFKNKYIILLLASLVFSLIHTYSLAYLIITYIGGLSFNFFYMTSEKRKGFAFSITFTVLLHALYNLVGFLLIEIFHLL